MLQFKYFWHKLITYEKFVRLYNRFQKIELHSPYENIYYCCIQKTGSQWLRAILRDPIVYRHTGLHIVPYVKLGLRYASFQSPLPKNTIGTHLYISYQSYLTIPKPTRYRTFFIQRDPRDIVVSWYFSAKYSHVPLDPIPALRKDLEKLTLPEGLRYIIEKLDEWGAFAVQRSWANMDKDHEYIRIYRYEEMAADNRAFLRSLFQFLQVEMEEADFARLYERHRFEKYSMGRKQGVEESTSHYRKGMAGDWQNFFDPKTASFFQQRTGDLLEVLGYRI